MCFLDCKYLDSLKVLLVPHGIVVHPSTYGIYTSHFVYLWRGMTCNSQNQTSAKQSDSFTLAGRELKWLEHTAVHVEKTL